MKSNIITFKNRGEFANAMLDKYYAKTPNTAISDIGAGFGHMKEKIKLLHAAWQPFDYVNKIEESVIWNLNNEAPSNVKKQEPLFF